MTMVHPATDKGKMMYSKTTDINRLHNLLPLKIENMKACKGHKERDHSQIVTWKVFP